MSNKVKLTDTVGDINKIKEVADKNLYKAKRSGRNKVVLE